MINFIKIRLQFGIFKIHYTKIQYIFHNFKIALLKNIINIVKFYVTFVTYKFCKFPNISKSVLLRSMRKIKVDKRMQINFEFLKKYDKINYRSESRGLDSLQFHIQGLTWKNLKKLITTYVAAACYWCHCTRSP